MKESVAENRRAQRTEQVFVEAHKDIMKQILSNAQFIDSKIVILRGEIDKYISE